MLGRGRPQLCWGPTSTSRRLVDPSSSQRLELGQIPSLWLGIWADPQILSDLGVDSRDPQLASRAGLAGDRVMKRKSKNRPFGTAPAQLGGKSWAEKGAQNLGSKANQAGFLIWELTRNGSGSEPKMVKNRKKRCFSIFCGFHTAVEGIAISGGVIFVGSKMAKKCTVGVHLTGGPKNRLFCDFLPVFSGKWLKNAQ